MQEITVCLFMDNGKSGFLQSMVCSCDLQPFWLLMKLFAKKLSFEWTTLLLQHGCHFFVYSSNMAAVMSREQTLQSSYGKIITQ